MSDEIEFVWGIKSHDDFTDRSADQYTLNDFSIYYLPDKKRYYYEIETIYLFKDSMVELEFLKDIFKQLTKWMRKMHYKTNYKPHISQAFGENNSDRGFASVEELYADFKLKCMGFALMHSKKRDNHVKRKPLALVHKKNGNR